MTKSAKIPPYQIAADIIGLFLEYRDVHGESEDVALDKAAREYVDAVEAESHPTEPSQGATPAKLTTYACKCGESLLVEGRVIGTEVKPGAFSRNIFPTGNPVSEEDSYVAFLRFNRGAIQVCDSDSEGAFKVWRHPRGAKS